MTQPRFFFIHVMKAAGTGFLKYAQRCLGAEAMFYRGEHSFFHSLGDRVENIAGLDFFLKNEPEVFRYLPWWGARFFDGHMPYVTSRALQGGGRPLNCLTMLRHPVDRVVSHLLQQAFFDGTDTDLRSLSERIYQDSTWRSAFGKNYQTKLFAMTEAETFVEDVDAVAEPWHRVMQNFVLASAAPQECQRLAAIEWLLEWGRSWNEQNSDWKAVDPFFEANGFGFGRILPQGKPIQIDPPRFEVARARLERCAVIGLAEQPADLVAQMHHRFGWPEYATGRVNTGPAWSLSAALRKQIARDNEADIEFYEYARKMVRKQRQARGRCYSLP